MNVFALQSTVLTVVALVLLAVKLGAFVDALLRPAEAYVAAGKLTKQGWLVILGLTAVSAVIWPSPFGLLSIAGTVAAFVYILDVRPALLAVTRRR